MTEVYRGHIAPEHWEAYKDTMINTIIGLAADEADVSKREYRRTLAANRRGFVSVFGRRPA